MDSNRVFDTDVQYSKYKVLIEVIRRAYEGGLENAYMEIPPLLSPGPKAETRCCIYKERAIIQDRVLMAMGGHKDNPNVIEVIDSACDECPIDGIYVTPACRGCMVHSCQGVCPKDAITIVNHRATVDKSKCIECGKCTHACPYSAIILQHRPCMVSCKVKAISIAEDKKARIDNSKCISCGACVYKCPFGAITDKSLILDVIDILKKSRNNSRYKVYAVLAPSFFSQCRVTRITQVVTAIRSLGFYRVVEAAMGADITLYREAKEWEEKKLLTTSCCPSFVMFVEKFFPELAPHISSSVSPMVETARIIKKADPTAKIVFIGPCTSKKLEYRLEKTEGLIDSVMSFEELQAFCDAFDIDATQLEDTPLDDASYYGRIFSKSGGITQGITDVARDLGVEGINPVAMNGIDECRANLLRLKLGKAAENFFEGMACDGGCLNGPVCITHNPRFIHDVEKYANEATEKTIHHSVSQMETEQPEA